MFFGFLVGHNIILFKRWTAEKIAGTKMIENLTHDYLHTSVPDVATYTPNCPKTFQRKHVWSKNNESKYSQAPVFAISKENHSGKVVLKMQDSCYRPILRQNWFQVTKSGVLP